MNDVFDLLCLLSVPGVGPQRIRNLVGHFSTARTVLEADLKALCQVDGIDEKTARAIRDKVERSFAEDQMQKAEKAGVQILTYWDPDYPEILKTIHDPPVLLFVKGALTESEKIGIAIVGTRTPTSYGRMVAEQFARGLAGCEIAVISGMARGVDTIAHRSALKAGGRTVAVLGSGVDVVYPPENKKLFEEIITSGAVVSEFVMGTLPESVHFPRRNRIISGLSRGTLVVEAGDKSGALITAYMALEQGRDVFAVPGNIINPKSKGTNRLIREGAKLVESVEDILEEIPEKQSLNGTKSIITKPDLKLLSESEKTLYEILGEEPKHIDQIALEGDITTSETLALLLSMELKNCIKQLTGMRFVRSSA